jgi:F-box and WD-40 domain protein 1/11
MDFLSAGNSSCVDDVISVNINTTKNVSTNNYEQTSDQYLTTFVTWNEHEQLSFVENLLRHMHNHQHGQVNSFLSPMLQRDFIGRLASFGLEHVAEKILGYLDDRSLKSIELVCREWYHVTSEGQLIERIYKFN